MQTSLCIIHLYTTSSKPHIGHIYFRLQQKDKSVFLRPFNRFSDQFFMIKMLDQKASKPHIVILSKIFHFTFFIHHHNNP
jgi:hypothetical protein